MRKLIIDTDCGIDDAVAIMFACLCKDVEVVAVTCVAGNTTVDKVFNNVGRVLEAVGHPEVPIYIGADENLMRKEIERWGGNGTDGFGNIDAPDTTLKPKSNRHAALEIIDLVDKYGKNLDIMTIGPLTNLAIALTIDKDLLNKAGHLTSMIGSEICMGNTSTMAEFNASYDPEAANLFFKFAKDVTILTWDLTVKNLLSWDVFDELKKGNKLGQLMTRIYGLYEKNFRATGLEGNSNMPGLPIPDPLCSLCYLYPEIIKKTVKHRVNISLSGESRGAMMVDLCGIYNIGNEQVFIKEVDREKYIQLFRSFLGSQ